MDKERQSVDRISRPVQNMYSSDRGHIILVKGIVEDVHFSDIHLKIPVFSIR